MSGSADDQQPEISERRLESLADAAPQHRKEWLEELGPWIGSGAIEVDNESDGYCTLIETHYPIGVNRIDWSRVRNHEAIDVISNGQRSWDQCRNALKRFEPTIRTWLQQQSALGEQAVIVVGDGADVVLRMSPETFLACYAITLVSGQHVYVFPASGAWCLNYTLEDQLFFGLATDAESVGPIPINDDVEGE